LPAPGFTVLEGVTLGVEDDEVVDVDRTAVVLDPGVLGSGGRFFGMSGRPGVPVAAF